MHVKQANTSSEASVPAFSVVGVIGAEGSPRTMEMASLFSLFEVPQLSYASSSALLDDTRQYSYFSRIVPSDNMQVSVRAGREGGGGGRGGMGQHLSVFCISLFTFQIVECLKLWTHFSTFK